LTEKRNKTKKSNRIIMKIRERNKIVSPLDYLNFNKDINDTIEGKEDE